MILLASCPGNGGASDSDGATYAYGGAGGMTGQNKEPSAWDIKTMADAGDTGKIIELLTAGQGGGGTSETTTPVDISVSDMGLPSGTTGSVTITMTVNGETKTYKADIEGDNAHFDIPVVLEGSEVSVRMDVRDTDGKLLLTGKTSKTVSGTDDALAVTLSDKIDVPVAVNFDVIFCAYTVHLGGVSTEAWQRYTGPSSDSFSASLGTEIGYIEGYAVGTDFKVYCVKAMSAFTVSEDSSVTLSKEGSAIADFKDEIIFSIYAPDGSFEPHFTSHPQFIGAYDKGYFEIVDAHIEFTSNYTGPTTTVWYPYDPAERALSSGNNVRVRYKLKAGSYTSGEFFYTTNASTRTPPAP